jgi:hypothetical protein
MATAPRNIGGVKGSPSELTIQNGTRLLMVVKLKERNRKKRSEGELRVPSEYVTVTSFGTAGIHHVASV